MSVNHKEGGFTFIEMLLVLMIVIIISTSAMRFTVKNIEQRQTEHFFRQFQMDLHYLQSYAMANKETVRVLFINSGTEYIGRVGVDQMIFRRKMPEGYWVNTQHNYRPQYLPNGNVTDFGVLTFHTPEGWRQLYIYIGKGRMLLDERIWRESN